jgi:PAS domain S-box-containing protein
MIQHTILIVEDNPATLRMVSFTLGKRGHRVLHAPDGKTAIELMDREQPVLVLQDVFLPDIDGFILVSELRKRARGQLIVLAFSGFASRSDEARISAVGFDDVIVKPIEPSRLIPIVEAYLPILPGKAERFGEGRRLLVVDDDPIQLKVTCFLFEKLGFAVQTAHDGMQALEMVRQSPTDAVVSDVLMPNMDGFGLALAIRQIPNLARLPLVLVTSSYVDAADRDLARRAGANDLVLRTPELREVAQALRSALAAPPQIFPVAPTALPEIESEWIKRVVRQLERHVLMNAGLVRRCSALSAELAVLTSISEAVLKHQSIESALDDALASCFDAGGISVGALYLLDRDGSFKVRPLGSNVTWNAGDLDSFFGNQLLLRRLIAAGTVVTLPSPGLVDAAVTEVLRRCGASTAMLVPLVHLDQPVGALFMVSQTTELDQDDWKVFAQGVGNQIAQTLALADAFTQREAAERQALESRAEWQALAQNAPDVIVRLEKDGTIGFVNRAAAPWDRIDTVGKWWLDAIPGEYHERLTLAFDAVMSRGEPSNHEIMLPAKDGKTDWYSCRIGPVRTDGVITGAIVISRHISLDKQREAQLIVSDRMASVGTLAAGVAHEINNPLAAVIANLDMAHREVLEIAERTGNRTLVEYLKDAQEAANRVRLIVRDLKVFSHAEQDRSGPTDLRSVLESTLRMAWNEIRHRARLVKDFAAVPPVEANESRLGQVFLNLIVNAAQAIPEGHADRNEVRIRTRMDPSGMVAIDVSDSGVGMSDEVQRRLFTPFYTTKPVGVGTGLGLSICERIVTSMMGRIQVQSKVGQGSTFTVLIPACQADVPMLVADSITGPTLGKRRGRLLVVDDEKVVAMAIQRSLSKENDVEYSEKAEDALVLLRAGRQFDVILCDLMMPEMTGMDLYAELLQSFPEDARRMIFLTGGAFTTRARQFLDAVPNLRIEKPFNIKQLRSLVNERLP